MSRSRLATILLLLIDNLSKESYITISYDLAEYTPPSETLSPIRKVGPLNEKLSGHLGDISNPSSIIIGLGYEKGKAIGIHSFLDTELCFLFIPKGMDQRFEKNIRDNNEIILKNVPEDHVFSYDIATPYKTYIDLYEIIQNITEISRPIIVPLGPKIFCAICTLISKEMGLSLPVWRVSSDFDEEPIDRKSSLNRYYLNLVV